MYLENRINFHYDFSATTLQAILKLRNILANKDQNYYQTLGFTGDELQSLCKLVMQSLHNGMLQLSLPKCRMSKEISALEALGRNEHVHVSNI